MYTGRSLRGEVFRKMFHLLLTLAMAIPLTPHYQQIFTGMGFPYDATLFTYALLTFASAFINSLQIKVPSIYTTSLKMLKDFRKRIIEYISESVGVENVSDILRSIDGAFEKHEERFTEFIASIEREYERKHGYIGITFGTISVTLAYTLFGPFPTLHGILALAVVDSITAIVTLLTKERCRKIFKHTTVSILTAFVTYSAVCFLIGRNILTAAAIASAAIIVELLSPEDNLTLPLAIALLTTILHL
ncbi:MAG: hypothetical protein N3D82_02375 [Ignisphaera sp.]|nr:hypothetical protein [Ignisphaera sp.]MCX8167863.1 hypothetical protein [Ignisphaera sp.]MDW8085496.1 hypothetical protein [Ignisphaera sp.]